jgi:hypothetical protein
MVDELERGTNLPDHYMIATAHLSDVPANSSQDIRAAKEARTRNTPKRRLGSRLRRLFRR